VTAPQHLDRLEAFDASHPLQEDPNPHAHVGGVVIVEGPAASIDDLRVQIASRLDLVPRYRQRLAHTAPDRARPVWVDDTHLDLVYRVRHTALLASRHVAHVRRSGVRSGFTMTQPYGNPPAGGMCCDANSI
jgi:hypothetical protein